MIMSSCFNAFAWLWHLGISGASKNWWQVCLKSLLAPLQKMMSSWSFGFHGDCLGPWCVMSMMMMMMMVMMLMMMMMNKYRSC